MTEKRPYSQSEHPWRVLSLHTRTRLLGTLNLAVAIGGRSTGWGRPGKPRRTFIGRHRAMIGGWAPYHRAIELRWDKPHSAKAKTLIRIPLGSGQVPLRRIPGLVSDTTRKGSS